MTDGCAIHRTGSLSTQVLAGLVLVMDPVWDQAHIIPYPTRSIGPDRGHWSSVQNPCCILLYYPIERGLS